MPWPTPASTSWLLALELILRLKADLVVWFVVCQFKARWCGETRPPLVELIRFLHREESRKDLRWRMLISGLLSSDVFQAQREAPLRLVPEELLLKRKRPELLPLRLNLLPSKV